MQTSESANSPVRSPFLPPEGTATLPALLEASVARVPERLALQFRAGVTIDRWTYRRLAERARAYAAFFAGHGVAKGDRVLIWAANHPEWVAAMFGTFLIGGVLVPLDVRSSLEFADRVVTQAQPRLAVAESRFIPALERLGVEAVPLGSLPAGPGEPPPVSLEAGDLAEIVFTSGTTGDPKGVMLTHGNIVSNIEAGLTAIRISEWSRMLSLLPLSHMFEQVAGCFAPLAVGASVCYVGTRQPAALRSIMKEWRPTIIIAVPQVLALFWSGIESQARRGLRRPFFAVAMRAAPHIDMAARRRLFAPLLREFGGALDFIASGGAPLDPALQRKWELLGIPVIQGYGTTECSPIVTINPPDDRRPGSVGKVLPGTQIRIAEDGEVLVRGPNVFVGYWQNQEATAAAFRDGWYATGDLGELRDGFLYLRGRKKDLIVLPDGQNVYPEDVERVLVQQPGIADAVVLGVDAGSGVQVHAVILEREPGAAASAVRAANERLDARQQILGFTVWPEEDFPRTHTLKVRRTVVQEAIEALLRQEQLAARRELPRRPRGSESPAERVRELIAEIARAPHHVADDSTLGGDLGLDSLARVELLSAIEEQVGVFIPDDAVGPTTTVAELVAMTAATGRRASRTAKFPTWPRSRPVRVIRRVLLKGVVFPLLRAGYALEVRGRENFDLIDEPALVISNHNMHLDQGMLLRAMPDHFRDRLAIAAAASDIFGNRIRGFGSALLGNAFPFAKEGAGVRDSLEYVAHMLAEGWHVLIFPEGKLTVGGPMQPFKSGIGLLAVETGAPVLPMRIDILRPGFYEGTWLPHPRARVRVNVGAPRRFERGTSYAAATAALEEAVRSAGGTGAEEGSERT